MKALCFNLLLTVAFCQHTLNCDVGRNWEPKVVPNFHPGRELASGLARGSTLQSIRLHFEYMDLSMTDSQESLLKGTVMSAVNNWFTNLLSVYPLQSNLKLSISKCNSVTVPSSHQTTGVAADYILYIYGNTTTATYIARGGACTYDSGNNNVLAGTFEVNIANFFGSGTQDNIINSIHEVTHALVFSSSLYSLYKQSDGTKYSSYQQTVNYPNRGKSVTALTFPTVLAKAQSAFGCSTLVGLELEDAGGSGSAGSHWDMRVMPHDYMSPSFSYFSVLSDITSAMFQDSGWYTVNWDYPQSIIWGKNQGCSWFENKCIDNGVAQFPGFCTNLKSSGCDVFRLSEASCYKGSYSSIPSYEQYYSDSTIGGASQFVDFCTYMYPYTNRFCQNTTASSSYKYYGEALGFTSRCVESTLLSKSYVFTEKLKGNCYPVASCTSDAAYLTVGTQTIKCPFTGGNVTISGYNGVLICPASSILCDAVPCLNACYGQGICKSGICTCNAGYGGNDCSIECDPTCKNCNGSGSTSCTSCYSTATVTNGACACPSGSTWDQNSLSCQSTLTCASQCSTCTASSLYACNSCNSNYYLFLGTCTQACPFGYTASNSQCSESSNPNVYKAAFYAWNNTYSSENSAVSLYFGSSNSFMPTPDSYDPTLSYSRGVYFKSSSYASLPPNSVSSTPILLSPVHSAEVWINPDKVTSEQCIVSKYNGDPLIEFKLASNLLRVKIALTSTADYSLDTKLCDGLSASAQSWQWAAYKISYSSSSLTTTLTLYLNAGTFTCTYSSYIFIDSTSSSSNAFLIGSGYQAYKYTEGFQGFLGSVYITNQNSYVPITPSSSCIRDNLCLSSCTFSQYVKDSSCGSCLSSCSNGCTNAYNCLSNVNSLCTGFTNFTTCTSCNTGSYLSGSTCVCIQYSSFDASSNTCLCNSGYTYVSQGYCAVCGNYFNTYEISAYFSQDYLSLILDFSRKVKSETSSDCSMIFLQDSLEKLGTSPSCLWVTSSSLRVLLGSGATLKNESIALNPQNVQASGTLCDLNIQQLTPTVQFKYDLPIPSACIDAPTSYSLTCAIYDLTISGDRSQGTDLTYSWAATITPSSSSIVSYIKGQTGAKFTIPASMLSVSTINVTLTITNFRGMMSNTTSSISVVSEAALSVHIDSGNHAAIYSNVVSQFKMTVSNFCNSTSTSASYSWSYVSSTNPSVDVSSVVSNSKQPNTLIINQNDLPAGYQYTFNATASDGTMTGWNTLTISVIPSNLVLVLNKVSGSVFNGSDLVLDASNSYDPDNPGSSLNFEWNCSQGSGSCLDSSGNQLIGNVTSSILTIPGSKLQVGATYDFHTKIYKNNRTTSGTVEILVADGTGSISVSQPLTSIDYQHDFTLLPDISTGSSATFLWSQKSGPSIATEIQTNNSYIMFPGNSMSQGTAYTYTLSMTYQSGSKIYSDISWATNVPPSCSNLTSSKNSDNSWLLSANSCTDQDSNFPLSYQFALYIDPIYYALSVPSQSSYISVNLPAGTWNLRAKVCDSIGSCSFYLSTVTVSSRVLQGSATTASQFNQMIKNPDLIPAEIIFYSLSTIDAETFNAMFGALDYYITLISYINNGVLDTALTSLQCMLKNQKALVNDTYLDLSFKILNWTFSNYDDSIVDYQVSEICEMFTPFYGPEFKFYMQLQELLDKVNNNWMSSTLPGQSKESLNSTFLSSNRLLPSNIANYTLNIQNRTVVIPSAIPIASTEVYDLNVFVYPLAGNLSDIIDITFKKSGVYQNYNLSINPDPSTNSFSNLSVPIAVQININNVNNDTLECAYYNNSAWTSDSCNILKSTESTVVFNTTHTSMFQVRVKSTVIPIPEDSSDCGTTYGPIASMIVVVWLALILITIFVILDRQIKYMSSDSVSMKSMLEMHELTTLFIPQGSFRRAQKVLQVMGVLLFELFICGAIYRPIDDPYNSSDGGFDDYSGKELLKVLVALLLGQVLSVAFIILNNQSRNFSIFQVIACTTSIFISIGSIIGIIILNIDYCSTYSDYWFIDFMIALPCEFFLFNPLHCAFFVLYKRLTAKVSSEVPGIVIHRIDELAPETTERGGLADENSKFDTMTVDFNTMNSFIQVKEPNVKSVE
ncbi:unnamed protein product [Blepharisma stoltei]|uniref:EGF-like domain-containing protein n=1 Tax=Blepharisma stoltei TaxID=1481888 RepID=A0AAU9JK80_9CILI|nr:unnamed protein product [Blepharisma stoltei]